ncbi:MAG: DUF2442 domain-containing protein [Candidatus Zhuqueibacterota bacterium]
MKRIHHVQKIIFKEDRMYLTVDDKDYVFQIEKISKRLLNATEIEREKFEISPSGYGIHWPLIDEDLSIDGLLGIKHIPFQKNEIAIM